MIAASRPRRESAWAGAGTAPVEGSTGSTRATPGSDFRPGGQQQSRSREGEHPKKADRLGAVRCGRAPSSDHRRRCVDHLLPGAFRFCPPPTARWPVIDARAARSWKVRRSAQTGDPGLRAVICARRAQQGGEAVTWRRAGGAAEVVSRSPIRRGGGSADEGRPAASEERDGASMRPAECDCEHHDVGRRKKSRSAFVKVDVVYRRYRLLARPAHR